MREGCHDMRTVPPQPGLHPSAPRGEGGVVAGQRESRRTAERQHHPRPDEGQFQPQPPAAVQDLLPAGVLVHTPLAARDEL